MPVILCNPFDTIAAASFVRKGKWPNGDSITFLDSSARAGELLESLERLRYVVVIRQTHYKSPAITRPGTFASGEYGADALLFELQSSRYLGGFKISAWNSRRIESQGNIDRERLERDLSVNAERSLMDDLAKRLPALARDEKFCQH